MVKGYKGEGEKGMGGYRDGGGSVDDGMNKEGREWVNGVGLEGENGVKKYGEWGNEGDGIVEGGGGFRGNGLCYGESEGRVVKVEVKGRVNNKEACGRV